jgi:hypothetical protein
MTALTLDDLDDIQEYAVRHGWRPGEETLMQLIAAARAHIAAWQPIESAPKDGTRVLIYQKEDDGTTFEHVVVAWWQPPQGKGRSGYWYDGRWSRKPTHWMPLPATAHTDGEKDESVGSAPLVLVPEVQLDGAQVEPQAGAETMPAMQRKAYTADELKAFGIRSPGFAAAPAITEGPESIGEQAALYGLRSPIPGDKWQPAPLPEPIAAGEEDVVVPFTGITKLDLPAERIIGGAAKANLDAVVIIGFDGDGDFFFSANKADGGEVLWLMELARKKLMEIGDQ